MLGASESGMHTVFSYTIFKIVTKYIMNNVMKRNGIRYLPNQSEMNDRESQVCGTNDMPSTQIYPGWNHIKYKWPAYACAKPKGPICHLKRLKSYALTMLHRRQ